MQGSCDKKFLDTLVDIAGGVFKTKLYVKAKKTRQHMYIEGVTIAPFFNSGLYLTASSGDQSSPLHRQAVLQQLENNEYNTNTMNTQ